MNLSLFICSHQPEVSGLLILSRLCRWQILRVKANQILCSEKTAVPLSLFAELSVLLTPEDIRHIIDRLVLQFHRADFMDIPSGLGRKGVYPLICAIRSIGRPSALANKILLSGRQILKGPLISLGFPLPCQTNLLQLLPAGSIIIESVADPCQRITAILLCQEIRR